MNARARYIIIMCICQYAIYINETYGVYCYCGRISQAQVRSYDSRIQRETVNIEHPGGGSNWKSPSWDWVTWGQWPPVGLLWRATR